MELCPRDVFLPLRIILDAWYRFGWVGVDFFFVLSGFLVSSLLFKEYIKNEKIFLKRFFIRRGFKIYPPFYLLLIFTILVSFFFHKPLTVPQILSEFLFFQNYGPPIWGHSWSLAVEEHFYLLIGLLLYFTSRKKGSNPFSFIPTFFVLLATLLIVFRVLTWINIPFSYKTHLFPTHLRIDSLFFGVFISYLYNFSRERFLAWVNSNRLKIVMACTLFIIPAVFVDLEQGPWMPTFGFTFLYLGFGGILSLILSSKSDSSVPIFSALGKYSYSIYLWHLPIHSLGLRFLHDKLNIHTSFFQDLTIYLCSSLILGVIMSKLVETPFLKLRDRLYPE